MGGGGEVGEQAATGTGPNLCKECQMSDGGGAILGC